MVAVTGFEEGELEKCVLRIRDGKYQPGNSGPGEGEDPEDTPEGYVWTSASGNWSWECDEEARFVGIASV
eukprot:CAMPEP_0197677658 /NCGR_PEP_ID=MMETSP1338-20131121/88777_1 /TAXON_ID=43686 ORGANISM="Pelagodinium beii, Strain RCC1491" /NCGR_SAMPLE_ID=MMETSP1338 /ASSEMBLY_ACC=CAM_ASM_000754 /LENGTH=69 /DNA_ID=CAMNT_0043258507 /DNA_START=24 /DNA_END=231 /DNA_ORIENTATION=+